MPTKTIAGLSFVSIVALTLASPAHANSVIDGDTIEVKGTTFHLHGIDAAEAAQICADGWPAGYEAREYLAALIVGRQVTCIAVPTAKDEETVAICRADGVDLGAAMVTGGHALAHVPFSARYISQEAAAQSARRGIHAHECTPPWQWRSRIDHRRR